MRTNDLSEALKNGRASSRELAKSFAHHARDAAHDFRGMAHDFRGIAHDFGDKSMGALHDLRERAVAITDRRPKRSASHLPFSLDEARSFGKRNARLLTTGGALLGLAAGGIVAWVLVRKAREKKLAADGATQIAPPADKLGRDAAHQGESAGLAEFVEPQSARFPLAGGRRARSRTNVSAKH